MEVINIFYLYDSQTAISRNANVEHLIKFAVHLAWKSQNKEFEISKDRQTPFLAVHYNPSIGSVTMRPVRVAHQLEDRVNRLAVELKEAREKGRSERYIKQLKEAETRAKRQMNKYCQGYRVSGQSLDLRLGDAQ